MNMFAVIEIREAFLQVDSSDRKVQPTYHPNFLFTKFQGGNPSVIKTYH